MTNTRILSQIVCTVEVFYFSSLLGCEVHTAWHTTTSGKVIVDYSILIIIIFHYQFALGVQSHTHTLTVVFVLAISLFDNWPIIALVPVIL